MQYWHGSISVVEEEELLDDVDAPLTGGDSGGVEPTTEEKLTGSDMLEAEPLETEEPELLLELEDEVDVGLITPPHFSQQHQLSPGQM